MGFVLFSLGVVALLALATHALNPPTPALIDLDGLDDGEQWAAVVEARDKAVDTAVLRLDLLTDAVKRAVTAERGLVDAKTTEERFLRLNQMLRSYNDELRDVIGLPPSDPGDPTGRTDAQGGAASSSRRRR